MIKWIILFTIYCFIGSVIEYFLNEDYTQRKTHIFLWPVYLSMFLGAKTGELIEWLFSKFFPKS